MLTEVRRGLNKYDRRGVWAMGLAGSSVTAANGSTGDCSSPNDSDPRADDIEDCIQLMNAQGVPIAVPGLGPILMGCSFDNPPNNWPNWQAAPRSNHAGAGINAVFCDGSVRWVLNEIDPHVWDAFLSRNGGEVLSTTDVY
jgi:prepilin-type processing-associated H-X9-DG protein